jgi:ribonuclease E
MLFNATQQEELRRRHRRRTKLVDLDIESASREQRKSNIYKGNHHPHRAEPRAAFIEYGEERTGSCRSRKSRAAISAAGVDVGRRASRMR